MENLIYMDNAATTAVKPEVLEVMLPYYTQAYGNPSSIYTLGQNAKEAIDAAREKVAKALNAKSEEIFFSGGGSESDNWVLKGIADLYRDKGNHIITTKIEHHAILHTAQYLEKHGFKVTYLDVDKDGLVDPKDLEAAITDDTILISIMFANNEIGTIEPIGELARIAKEHKILFHTDAVQAVGNVPIDVKELGVDMLSLSGHKIHAPKGVGALYVRKGIRLPNLIHGGAQEKAKRAGTENVAGIVGLGKAIELATENIEQKAKKISELRDYMIENIEKRIDFVKLNGSRTKRLPGNINFSFEFIEGEGLLLFLDLAGIAASSGSACTSGSLDPSHVLLSIGLPHEIAHGSLRLTINEDTTYEEADYVIEELVKIVDRLRDMSPLWHERKNK
ncbi:MAG: cysteine desulfurase NifS [Tissierellia bacterium]|nr:cysteine desulfurase NifS [Tissierellia bacterium]